MLFTFYKLQRNKRLLFFCIFCCRCIISSAFSRENLCIMHENPNKNTIFFHFDLFMRCLLASNLVLSTRGTKIREKCECKTCWKGIVSVLQNKKLDSWNIFPFFVECHKVFSYNRFIKHPDSEKALGLVLKKRILSF